MTVTKRGLRGPSRASCVSSDSGFVSIRDAGDELVAAESVPALIDVWHGPIYIVIVVVMLIARLAIIWRRGR
jgi:hypothetical protein